MRHNPSRVVGILSVAATLSSAGIAAYSSGTSETGCLDSYIGNGYCNLENNNAECGRLARGFRFFALDVLGWNTFIP